jgi:hypothetical protein
MRCPKCGYISFDHLETCKKCQKYVGDTLAEINGTAHDAVSPLFLTIKPGDGYSVSESVQGEETLESSQNEESTEIDFVFDDGEAQPASTEIEFRQSSEDMVIEFDDLAEFSPRGEFTLEMGDLPGEMKSELPAMDFSDLDISDLAPPTREESDPIQFAPQPILSDLEPVVAQTAAAAPPIPRASSPVSGSLEDLNFNGLDLETPAKLVTGSAAGRRYLPSVKTGTALDKFDIDLGELFNDNKK